MLQKAVEERRAWQDEQTARDMGIDESEDAAEPLPPPSIYIAPDNEERKLALFKDKHLRLLLKTLGFERLGLAEDVDAQWIIPSDLTADNLEEALEQIKEAEHNPPSFDDDKTAADLIRSKAASRPAFLDDSEDGSGSGVDDAMFPPNLKEKRKAPDDGEKPVKKRRRRRRDSAAEEPTEAELEAKRRARDKKEREKNSKIKSKLYVTLSDDESDAEADAEFFRLEEERRARTAGAIKKAIVKAAVEGETGGKKKGKKAAAAAVAELSANSDDDEEVAPMPKKKSKAKTAAFMSDDSGSDEAVPAPTKAKKAKKTAAFISDDSDSDEAVPAPKKVKKAKRNDLAALLDNDSDDEDVEMGGLRDTSPIELSDNSPSSSEVDEDDEDGGAIEGRGGSSKQSSPVRKLAAAKLDSDGIEEQENVAPRATGRRKIVLDDSDDE
jgi:replication fork protection complex subunit Tof1/Swi1